MNGHSNAVYWWTFLEKSHHLPESQFDLQRKWKAFFPKSRNKNLRMKMGMKYNTRGTRNGSVTSKVPSKLRQIQIQLCSMTADFRLCWEHVPHDCHALSYCLQVPFSMLLWIFYTNWHIWTFYAKYVQINPISSTANNISHISIPS